MKKPVTAPHETTARRAYELYEKSGHPTRSAARSRNHSPAAAASHDAIARRAYELYQASGCPEGRDVEFWLEAERQLKSSS